MGSFHEGGCDGWEEITRKTLSNRIMDLKLQSDRRVEQSILTSENEKKEPMTTDLEYINLCFVDLTDSGDLEKVTFGTNRVVIDIKRIKTVNKTFNNYLSYIRQTAKTLEMVDEAITKVRINHPHVNVVQDIYESTLRITLDI